MRIESKSWICSLVVGVLCFIGCGGGTRGTDGGFQQRVFGTTQSTSGESLEGGTVTILETGDSSKIDQLGKFSIVTSNPVDKVTLLVRFEGQEVSTESVQIENDQTEIEVQLLLSTDSSQLEIVSFSESPISEPLTPAPNAGVTEVEKPTDLPTPEVPVKQMKSLFVGQLIDVADKPVYGVHVYLYAGSKIREFITDQDGLFRFELQTSTRSIKLVFGLQTAPVEVDISKLPKTPSRLHAIFRTNLFTGTSTSTNGVEGALIPESPRVDLIDFDVMKRNSPK